MFSTMVAREALRAGNQFRVDANSYDHSQGKHRTTTESRYSITLRRCVYSRSTNVLNVHRQRLQRVGCAHLVEICDVGASDFLETQPLMQLNAAGGKVQQPAGQNAWLSLKSGTRIVMRLDVTSAHIRDTRGLWVPPITSSQINPVLCIALFFITLRCMAIVLESPSRQRAGQVTRAGLLRHLGFGIYNRDEVFFETCLISTQVSLLCVFSP